MTIATIEKITSLSIHDNATELELAKIKGWQVCVKKGLYRPGDFCVFVTVDSIFEEHPEYEFLRNKNFRIKTIKLRGKLSQGIAFPISLLNTFGYTGPITEGIDVSTVIKCKHYEKPEPANLGGNAIGYRPSFIRKTDEDNIKNNPYVISELHGLPYYITQKIDGSSGTYYHHNSKFGVCSRNQDLKQDSNNVFWKISDKYNIQKILFDYYKGANIAIQGECYGLGIQDNLLQETELKFAMFNILNTDTSEYYGFKELIEFSKVTSIPMVTVLEEGNSFNYTLELLQEYANGLRYPNGNLCEGIVIRPKIEKFSQTLQGRLSGKIISEPFELKYGH